MSAVPIVSPLAMNESGHRRNPIDREILRLAGPAIVSNITVPLLGLADTAVSGHLGDTSALGAIAVGAMMLNVAYWLFGFLRTGSTGLTAIAYGGGDQRQCLLVLWRSLLLSILIGILLVASHRPLAGMLLAVAGGEADVTGLARRYYSICICGSPALLATMSLSGWMVGMQSTVRPMIVAVTTNVINIALTVGFVYGAGMGFAGVAYGTLVAQWCGLALALVLARGLGARFAPLLRISGNGSPWLMIMRGDGLRRFFRVNSDLMGRSACIMAVSVAVTSIGARLGTVTLAANAVIMQFFIFFSYFMDGFAFAGEALSGRFKGAGNYSMLRFSIRRLLCWSVAMATVFFAVYRLWYAPIAAMITPDAAVLERISGLRLAVWLLPPLSVGAFICDGFYIGMTDTRRLLRATMAAACVFFIVAFVPSGFRLPDSAWLWGAFLSYLAVRGILLGLMLPRLMRSTVRRG